MRPRARPVSLQGFVSLAPPHGEERAKRASRTPHGEERAKRASRTMGGWLRARPSPVLRDAAFGRSSGRGRAYGERVLEGELVAAAGALRHAEKQLVERNAPLDQALLLRVADQRLEVLAVAVGQSVFPRIAPKNFLLLLPGLAIPRERDDARVLHAPHRDRLRLVEGHEHVDRDPRVSLHDLLLEADHMHDREDAGLGEIL